MSSAIPGRVPEAGSNETSYKKAIIYFSSKDQQLTLPAYKDLPVKVLCFLLETCMFSKYRCDNVAG
jgi:hypothetical protein